MRVALVSSDGRCGIAEHSNLLVQSVQQADPGIEFVRDASWLNPGVGIPGDADIVHLNYHRGLHSQWTPRHLESLRASNYKTVVTFHDTYETQPDRLPFDMLDVCDAMVIHEPALDLMNMYDPTKVFYWRQGVPEPTGMVGRRSSQMACRPYVGTCGFAFPWKGFELLCDAATSVGWGVKILSHNATSEQANDWERRNPWLVLDRQYYSTPEMIAELAECDATAFLYSCANSGTSGAIRLGIAAGKPLLATDGCRQFRDLQLLTNGKDDATDAIRWVSPDQYCVLNQLVALPLTRFDPNVVALREQDSWRHLGKKYADLYKSLL